MRIDATFWDKLQDNEKEFLVQMALLSPPVSFDILFHTLSSPPTTALKFLEKFSMLDILAPCKAKGTGFYYFPDKETAPRILKQASEEKISANARSLIAHYSRTGQDIPDTWLEIAHLYHICHCPLDHAATVIKAADYSMSQNNLTHAFTYYYLVIENLSLPSENPDTRQLYIKAALGLCANSEDILPLSTQERIVTQALEYMEEKSDPDIHVPTLIFKARCMMRQGDFEGAEAFHSKALALTETAGDPVLKEWVAAYNSDIEIWRGQIINAIYQYEKLVGKLEAFPTKALFLKAYARLGWSYGICGDIYRGLGLVNVVQKKAVDLKIRYMEIYSEVMKLMILSDTRRIKEAQASLDIILNYPESELDHYVLWAAYGKKAYFAYLKDDLKTAYTAHQKSTLHSNSLGCSQYHGTDNLEYLHAFEQAGLGEDLFQKEMARVLAFPDIYTRGAALRYRAMYAMAEDTPNAGIHDDLEQSLELLETAGAKVELAQTQVTLSQFLLTRDTDEPRVRKLLKAAWDTFSSVNADLFPQALKQYVEEEDSETLLVDTIVEVGNTLSQVRDRFTLLSKMIRVIIRLVGAERGGIFLLDQRGKIKLESSRNLEPEGIRKKSFASSLDIIHRVITTGKESISFGKYAALIITGQIREQGWVICYPIVLRENIMGVLYVDNSYATMRLTNQKLPLLKAIGNQIAVALDNVDAYEKITELRHRLEAETHFYRKESQRPQWTGHIVGESSAIRKVLETIKEVAPSDATILINGETGVGKELAARAIHAMSKKAEGPFIPINIATISPELVYSELFGHTRGSFTGAVKDHVGRFELAHGGSFFMDDVDGLSLDIQVKLLRVLEEHKFQKVGGTQTITSDFRLIAATNQDLTQLVRQGKFRSDFYYRLNVVPLTIPPLRQRKQDIPRLATHFLKIFSTKMGKPVPRISSTNMDRLMNYEWPGNVRELSHYIERAVILSRGSSLKLPRLDTASLENPSDTAFLGLDMMIHHHITEALNRCNWKVSGKDGAAALLKMKPQTLYSKINKLGIRKK